MYTYTFALSIPQIGNNKISTLFSRLRESFLVIGRIIYVSYKAKKEAERKMGLGSDSNIIVFQPSKYFDTPVKLNTPHNFTNYVYYF